MTGSQCELLVLVLAQTKIKPQFEASVNTDPLMVLHATPSPVDIQVSSQQLHCNSEGVTDCLAISATWHSWIYPQTAWPYLLRDILVSTRRLLGHICYVTFVCLPTDCLAIPATWHSCIYPQTAWPYLLRGILVSTHRLLGRICYVTFLYLPTAVSVSM